MHTKPFSVKVACLKNKIRIFYALHWIKINIRRPKNAIAVNSLIFRILHIPFLVIRPLGYGIGSILARQGNQKRPFSRIWHKKAVIKGHFAVILSIYLIS